MARRPEPQETLKLALELLKRIPRSRKVSATELREQLAAQGTERDLRTIQRQLEMLSAHFDIERDDRSKPYGYKWKEQSKGLSVPSLTPQESLLLLLAKENLRSLLPAGLMKSMDGFFNQASATLGPNTTAKRDRAWLRKVRVVSATQPLLPPVVDPKVFDTISNGLYADESLDIVYKNASQKRITATVMPLGLAQQGPRLYLVCRFEGFRNERSLALHRVVTAKATGASFARPVEFDLKKYDDEGRFGFGEGKPIRLKFRITASEGQHLLESPISTDQRCRNIDPSTLEIQATVVESRYLVWWLRGFGPAVTVVSPRGLLRKVDPPRATDVSMRT